MSWEREETGYEMQATKDEAGQHGKWERKSAKERAAGAKPSRRAGFNLTSVQVAVHLIVAVLVRAFKLFLRSELLMKPSTLATRLACVGLVFLKRKDGYGWRT